MQYVSEKKNKKKQQLKNTICSIHFTSLVLIPKQYFDVVSNFAFCFWEACVICLHNNNKRANAKFPTKILFLDLFKFNFC